MTIRTKADLNFYRAADLAARGKSGSWHLRWTDHLAWYQVVLRKLEYWQAQTTPWARVWTVLLRLRFRQLSERYGFTLSPGCFGPGLVLVHRGTVVVHKDARIGKNCRLHQNVTIGVVRGQAPVLGDNVWIATGAAILGGLTIGDRVAIAANAVVTKDVPAGITVGGIPARQISEASSDGWIRDGVAVAEAELVSGS